MSQVPDWKMERNVLGELPADEQLRVRRQLDDDDNERLAALRRSDRTILVQHPPRVVGQALRARLGLQRRAPRSALVALPLLAVAAAALFVTAPRAPYPDAPRVDDAYFGVKGEPALVIHRQLGVDSERLADAQSAAAGDVLQLSYQAMGWPYGVLLSIDGGETVTLHFPLNGQSSALSLEGRMNLEQGYRLDDAPSFERFFFVTAPEPLDVGAVLAAARELASSDDAATAALHLDINNHQTSLILWKAP